LAEVFFWISAFRAVDQFPNAIVVSPYASGSFLDLRWVFFAFRLSLSFFGWFLPC
jgi:hypothetical protein